MAKFQALSSILVALFARAEGGRQLGLQLPTEDVLSQDGTPRATALLDSLLVASDANDAARAAASGGSAALVLSADLEANAFHLEPTATGGRLPVAWARYNNSVQQTGWGFLEVGASEDSQFSDDLKMYAAGYLEGFLSAKQIRDFKHNADIGLEGSEQNHHGMENIHDLFGAELSQLRNNSGMVGGAFLSKDNAPADNWWRHARYALLQTWGVMDAYNRQADSVGGKPMSMVDMIVLSSDGETPELEAAYDMEEALLRQSNRDDAASGSKGLFLQKSERRSRKSRRAPKVQRKLRRHGSPRLPAKLDDAVWRQIKESTGRCSALVRLSADNKDLMIGHTTFSDFSEMTRIFKYYDLPLEGSPVRRMGFSSYPGVVGSTDDYYLMDSGLTVTETTISMLSDEAYDKLDDKGDPVPDFMRIMMASRLANTGKEWAELMQKSASGTYSSQWMVVDYNKFTPGERLGDGTLYVVEQAPGITHLADMTETLRDKGFWSSENRAWFKDVRDGIGATEAEELHGNLFSADENPRAHIFKATAPKVATLSDFRSELQRNKWPHEVDGGEGNTPDHAISARGDLDKENPNPNGGVDSKVTNACLMKRLQCNAISGPTKDDQKPFRWRDENGKELYPGVPHDGQPDVWNFAWVRMAPEGQLDLDDDCGATTVGFF